MTASPEDFEQQESEARHILTGEDVPGFAQIVR